MYRFHINLGLFRRAFCLKLDGQSLFRPELHSAECQSGLLGQLLVCRMTFAYQYLHDPEEVNSIPLVTRYFMSS